MAQKPYSTRTCSSFSLSVCLSVLFRPLDGSIWSSKAAHKERLSCQKIKCNSYRCADIENLTPYLLVCVRFLDLTGSRGPQSPSPFAMGHKGQSGILLTLFGQSVLTCSLGPTQKLLRPVRPSVVPRGSHFIFNLFFFFFFLHQLPSTTWPLNLSDFTLRTPPVFTPQLPSSVSAPPLQLLPRLFSSVVPFIFSSSFPASSSSSCAVWACLGASLTLENLPECSAAAVSWGSEGEREEEGGREGETEGRRRHQEKKVLRVQWHNTVFYQHRTTWWFVFLLCAGGKCDCWGQKL